MDRELRAYLEQRFAAVDGYFAELRAHMDQRFAEVFRRLESHDRKFAEHDRRFDAHDRRFEEFDRRFDLFAEALVRIEHRPERARIA